MGLGKEMELEMDKEISKRTGKELVIDKIDRSYLLACKKVSRDTKFIVFEGPAGAGKSTIINAIMEQNPCFLKLPRPKLIFIDKGNDFKAKIEQENGLKIPFDEHVRRANFFLDDMLESQKQITDGGFFLADRWFFSTLFYQLDLINRLLLIRYSSRVKLGDTEPLLERSKLVEKITQVILPSSVVLCITNCGVASCRKGICFDEKRYGDIRKAYKMQFPKILRELGVAHHMIDTSISASNKVFQEVNKYVQSFLSGERG